MPRTLHPSIRRSSVCVTHFIHTFVLLCVCLPSVRNVSYPGAPAAHLTWWNLSVHHSFAHFFSFFLLYRDFCAFTMPRIQVTHAQTSVPSPLHPFVYASSPPYVHARFSITKVFKSGSISSFSSHLHSKCVHVTLFSLHLYIFFLSILATSTVISKFAYVTSNKRLFYVHFLSLRYPYMHLYHPFIPHTHTPVSLRSLHFYWSSIAVPSRPLFRPLVSSTSFCIPPSKFFQTSHSSFLPFTLEKPAFIPKCLKSKCLTSSFLPPSIIHLFVLSPVLHPYINVSILNWFSIQRCCFSSIFSQFLHPPPPKISQSMHHAYLISPLLHTNHSSFLPFVLENLHLFHISVYWSASGVGFPSNVLRFIHFALISASPI